MGGNMWPPGMTRLLVIAVFLLVSPLSVRTQEFNPSDSKSEGDELHASRIQRDVNGVTTVLLVPARPGKSVPPVGLLTKTARTFVQDGASTEYATQVLGTTLENGRLYARILSTSSRVFYEKEVSPVPVSPFVVYPSRAPQDEWQLRVDLENTPVKIAKDLLGGHNFNDDVTANSNEREANNPVTSGSEMNIPSERENDIFNKRELNVVDNQRFKPAKVRAAENLPTYTVKQEYGLGHESFDNIEDEAPRNFRPRAPKIFKQQTTRVTAPKKIDAKPLATVTYHGFADFTTIVGDTVIVFSPSTSPVPVGRAATTIKGDATLRPDDGIGIVIQPTRVVNSRDKITVSVQQQPRDTLLDAINGGRIDSTNDDFESLQPSTPSEIEVESSSKVTTPILVPLAETGSLKPTGLLKVVDSTTATDGTTTHYKSLIYGTYIGTNYAQIIHTSSNVYFFPDEASATYDSQDTTLDYSSTDTETEEPDMGTTIEMPKFTTPKPTTRANKIKPETNEVTTPYRETTENILTTLKDILANAKKRLSTTTESPDNIESNTDSDITNDIATGDPQGRSIKGSSPKNNFPLNAKNNKNEEQVSFATRLLPSTEYKTFTYFTTFFVPNGELTTTSVKSREVVSSEVTYLTELILPSATVESSRSTILNRPKIKQREPTTSRVITTTEEPEEEQTTKQDEEIELIFKTLYTTYTYLTTFFQESTSSISSREVVETNVVTQTVGPNGISGGVAGLFNRDESVVISATSVSMISLPTIILQPGTIPEELQSFTTEATATTLEETTEGTLTTIQDEETTIDDSTDFTKSDDDEDLFTNLEPSPTPTMVTEVPKEQVKTYFTTYTYFTTIFVDDETEIETRTEVFTNIVTEGIQPTAVVPVSVEPSSVTTPKADSAEKPTPSPEILAYLEAIQRQKSQEEALLLAKKVHETNHHEAPSAQETTYNDLTTESMSDDDLTTVDERHVTDKTFVDLAPYPQVTPNPPIDGEVIGSMITDVISSSSSGGGTVLGVMDKRNAVPEDQELSESNHHDVESAPTLLLQTSYTTFTYFTTMYKGDATNVVSRLDTVTNVVTETIRPTAVLLAETSTLPVTYFTTFTYWTTFYKGGDTVTTSREETVSNVLTPGVSPTPTLDLGVVMTYRPDVTPTPVDEDSGITEDSKVVADNEVTLSDLLREKITTEKIGIITPQEIVTLPDSDKINTSTISPEPTTFYTTFTYFTTSYIGNETILNSRLETITSVALPKTTLGQATGRAIGGGDISVQTINTERKIKSTVSEKVKSTSKSEQGPKTGLISTIRSSKIDDGTTTHYATDVYGTYIDGLYAQVVESSSRLETATPSLTSSATPVLPTGVLSLNKGSIVDADEVTTVYFTTKQIGTLIDGLYARVIESTSSTIIDSEKKATVSPVQGHRTGLVRLIQGLIETNDATTVYQSKVIGTSIDGRYAQIIESTSSFVVPTPTVSISVTSTLQSNGATGIPEITPSPAVIQSSLAEDSTMESVDNDEEDSTEQSEEGEDGEEDDEDEDGQKSTKKSRLTFSSRKRTFTPVIRPFLSRSRPTFNPKRKGSQAATTITRTDITPTITATLAGKGNRFASTRGRVTSPIGPYSSTLTSSGSRRFSGRGRGSSTLSPSSTSGFPAGSSRGRGVPSRITPSSTFPANRRGPSSIRGSSTRPGPRGSSSIHPGASSRFRAGIRPSSTLNKIQPTIRHEDQDDEANEFSTTTLTTEEAPHTEYEEGSETVTAPVQTTTESSRRSTNPLLRFRRPLNLSGTQRTVVTPRVPVTTSNSRRNGNLARQNTAPTVPSRGSTRGGNRPTPPLVTRSRQGGQLFPPRGLPIKRPDPIEEPAEDDEEFEGEDEENFEDDPIEEIADNDYEGSEDAATTTKYGGNRRQGKAVGSNVSIRPFGTYRRGRRVRRQASQLRSLTNRFRRPTSSNAKAEDRSDVDDSASKEEVIRSIAPTKQYSSRYIARGRSLSSARPSSNPSKTSAERLSAESTESLVKPRVRTNPRVKPSPTSSSSRQFTLREKDSPSRPGYKRPSGTNSRNRSTGKQENGLRVRPKVRNGSSRSTESPTNNRRASSTRSSTRSSNNKNSNRRVPSQRIRGSHEDIRESPFVHKDNDGTITVTHYVPTEVTIPVVNNGITEQRNIVTAHPSTEVLGPEQYSTVVGGNGRPLVVIASEATGSNAQGQLEVTRFLLHETPTTRVSHTLTSLGGRRASQSIIIPSTVYSVENVVSTVQPSLRNDNGPLANILLSQLLLGQLNQQNPLLGGAQPQGTPTTQYNTRTTSYVTTITKHQSTVIPLTFRGKEILTTLVDSSTNVVTATEFITDTVVVTPTAVLPAAGLNSLLLLLQQPQQQQQSQHPLLDPLFAAAPQLTQSNTLPGEVERRHQPADFDYKPNNYDDSEEEIVDEKPSRSRVRPSNRHNDSKKVDKAPPAESSVVTLYVSGRRPGEFSTVLSTVKIGEQATVSRRRRDGHRVQASAAPSLHAASDSTSHLAGSEEPVNAHAPTQSLESVVDESLGELFEAFGQKQTRDIDHRRKRIEEDDYENDYRDNDNEYSRATWRPETEPTPRKVVRVRVPVVRSRTERQHKYTVVRRRPLVTYVKPVPPIVISTPTARRIIVTRVRSRGPANQIITSSENYDDNENLQSSSTMNRHRVTVTRRRKIRPTSISETFQRPKVTRKKLINIRPIVQPTPTFAIITTGFYSAPSSSDEIDETEVSIDEELPVTEITEEPEIIVNSEKTPNLEGSPNDIDSNPVNDFDDGVKDEPSKFNLKVPEEPSMVSDDEPVIITDHFFFPASGTDDEEEENYEDKEEEEEEEEDNDDGDYYETTTGINENETVMTEEPQLTVTYVNQTLEDTNENLPETTTSQATTQVSEVFTETEEKTTDKIEEQSEENTESSVTIATDVDQKIDDQTESTTIQEGMMDDLTTENIMYDSNDTEYTLYPETTMKPVTIYIEEPVEDVTPQTTMKPLTINIEKVKVDVKFDKSVFSDITINPEEVTEEKTTTPALDEPALTVESTIVDTTSESPITVVEIPAMVKPIETTEDDLSVLPLESYEKSLKSSSELVVNTFDIRPTATPSLNAKKSKNPHTTNHFVINDSDVPSVIPLEAELTTISTKNMVTSVTMASVMTNYGSPTTEDIEAGLADELYLSLSRPDFPQILPSKSSDYNDRDLTIYDNVVPTSELSTRVYYTETVVTSTKLRTYTYIVTKLNGLETEVTSSTTVRPRVTTLTLTVPVTVTISPTLEPSARNNVVVEPVYSPVSVAEYTVKEEEEGRRFNLATRVMSNGVEVIVAGPTPALRWENSNPQPTLTLSDTVLMLMPHDDPNEFVTKTCTTTFTYLNTITKDGATIVSTDQQVVANTATEERHRKTGTESASVTLEASPTLRTEVFKTTYTYLTLNTDHPDVNNALGSSMKVIANTVTAPQHYLNLLEPSEAVQPETNTYLSTRVLEKTFMEDGRTRIETTSDTVTQLIITESALPPPRPTSVATTLTALDNTDESMTDITKTYFITYTYLNTYLEKGSTVIHTNIATSTDVVLEKVPAKKTAVQSVTATPTPEPIQIFATKTYLTTFTYFTTLLQAGADGETSTTISSRSHIVENIVTESIAPSLLDAGYMNALLTTAHHSDSVKNVVTGSTIIFFDEEDQIDPTTTTSSISPSTTIPELETSDKVSDSTPESLLVNPTVDANGSEALLAEEQSVVSNDSDNNATSSSEDVENKRPSTTPGNSGDLQVSNLLSLGSLGINSLSALGPVITAMAGMAGLLQSKSTATRRNDTVAPIEAQEVTTQRSPIYIPVAEFADGDIETAESQNIAAQLVNPGLNYIPETRHKVAASLADGIPISPGEVITANSDVIIGKPGKLGPRPPNSKVEENIGMKPPPIPVPNIPVHPVLEIMRDDESDLQAQSTIQSLHRNTQIQILSAHQVYEKHLKIPGPSVFPSTSQQGSTIQKRPQHVKTGSPLRQSINKQDHLDNDPLLIPPSRPNVEQYANPNINPKDVEWNRERFRRPWSAKDPIKPALPSKYDVIQADNSHETKLWPNRAPTDQQDRPTWAQKDPLQGDTTIILESSETKNRPSEPIIHQVPHVIDRSTGQPLLVNIQPSQVANVVIPQGGTQALIFGDTSEPHISGQYFDDPSPYPEPEVGPGFIGVEKIENNPAIYMLPPAAPAISFKPLPQQSANHDHHHHHHHHQTIPLSHSQSHFNLGRPQDNSQITTSTKLEKRPTEISLIQRPDSQQDAQSSGQGHVHTEILVHHRPESVNVRPQLISHLTSNSHNIYQESSQEPPRREYTYKQPRPSEQLPPRRSEIISVPTEKPHQYMYLDNKSGNEAGNDLKLNWKFDRKPQRNPSIGRPDRRPERPSNSRPHPPVSHSYPIFERPATYANRKPQYPGASSRPNPPGSGHYSGSTTWYTQNSQESSKKPVNQARPSVSSYPKETISRPSNTAHEIIVPSENVPTGAIGYYNPSNDPKVKPVDTRYYPQLPTIKPEIQSFGEILPHPDDEHEITWKIDTQTERTSIDSMSDASENVKFQNNSQDQRQDSHDDIDKHDVAINDSQSSSTSNVSTQSEEMKVHGTSTYDTVGSVNTVVGKPVDIQQTINYENQNEHPSKKFDHQSSHDYGQESQNGDYYENPIVQGKPYSVYNDKIDLERPYGSNQRQDERPDYEVIQGVPFSQHAGKRPSQEQKPTAARPYERDDTIDLTPPAMITQFGGPAERPARPFTRPQGNARPDVRPVSHPRPDHDDTHVDTNNKNRPIANRDQSTNYPVNVVVNESHERPGNSPNNQDITYPPRYEWSQGSQTLENTASQIPPRNENRYETRNQTNDEKVQTSSYFPSSVTGSKTNDRVEQSVNNGQTSGTRVHPAYPHILTKPRPRVPGPITITSNSKRPDINSGRPKIQFSLPVKATGEEKDSKTQTERPPSMLITASGQKNKKQKQETLETASQTNFATPDKNNADSNKHDVRVSEKPTESKTQESSGNVDGKPRVPSQNMMPPPLRKNSDNGENSDRDKDENGLKPPPRSTDVVGLSPPPVAITTTGRPKDDRFAFTNDDETGLRPPPKYIPLKESVGAVTPPPQPSTSMVPPSPRPTMARPFLVDLLSQDMVPPPLVIETSRPTIEIATVRPAIAVSGSIQIATAVAASHIPVMQDIESKIPIIHGTVDLPIVMDVSDIMKPLETDRSEHVSIYTVRPFETRPVSRVSVQPTTIITSNLIMPTKLRTPQISHVETIGSSISRMGAIPTKFSSYDISRKTTNRPDHPIFLEPSRQNIESSNKIEATQSLIRQTNKPDETGFHSTRMQKYPNDENSAQGMPTIVTRVHSSITRMTNTLLPRRDKLPKTKEFAGTVIHEVMKNGTTATVEMKPKAVTHFRTLTVTRTETSVLGSPPTTRTLLLTHTLTSTIVETVTETLLRPTSVVATVTSTVLQSITRLPNSYENTVDNDSIFVVMSDQNPPAPGAEEVEAEYGEDEVSRDEQEPAGNEINRVLAGGILGAPIAPIRPAINHCQPECKASKAEICSNAGTEARCVCRPGFARMFPDRPCKPTYTYTVRVGLERMGREPIFYEAALNDTSSTAFRRLALPTREALDRTMMQSDLRDVYRSLDIAGFMPNPTQVEFHVQLTDNANETRLKDVLRKYLIGSNYSLGGTEVYAARDLEMIEARDFDECTMHDGGPHHDCSPHAGCFNLRGSYQCSCKEGWADLSENPAYPGRVCSQAPLGCAGCNNKGHCTKNTYGHEICECFPWHSGQRCQVNLKVLLIALVTTGAILLGLLAVCLGLACFRHPGRRGKSGDRRAMIPGTAGDTSSEGSVTDLAIPHHVPHVLPPPPRTIAPAPPAKRPARKITPNGKRSRSPRKASVATGPSNEEHCDRSLTVMIPRAKYRSTPQTPQNYKSSMSTFAADEHKLLSYLESGAQSGTRKPSTTNTKDFKKSYEESGGQTTRGAMTTSGALVSAGFQVSATVTRTGDAESTMARSCAETAQIEQSTKTMRSSDLQGDVGSTIARSCADTSTSTKLLRLDFGDSSGSTTIAKSCGETTIQTSTKIAPSRRSDSNKDTRDARDSGSEGHMTMERDLGSTLRLSSQHPALYKPDRTSDRDSNFDSL